MRHFDEYPKASKILAIVGIIIGMLVGIAVCSESGMGLNFGIILIFTLIGGWLFTGFPYIKEWFVETWDFIRDRNGCLQFIVFILFGIYAIPIVVLLILFILCPITSIRFMIEDYGYTRRKKRERREEAERNRLQAIKDAENAARAKKKAEEDARRRQRQSNASDFQHNAKMAIGNCELISGNGNKVDLSPSYESVNLQEKIWAVSNAIFLKLQKLENTVTEINAGDN